MRPGCRAARCAPSLAAGPSTNTCDILPARGIVVAIFLILIGLIVGYLLGSIPFGLILTRLAGTGDIRSVGSGNIGATNVLRTGRKGLAAATLLGDMMKGAVAVLLMKNIGGTDPALAAGFAAVLGHVFP